MYFAVNSEEIETAIKENEEGYDDLMGKVLRINYPFTPILASVGMIYRCKNTNTINIGKIEIAEPAATKRQSSEKALARLAIPRGSV